MPLPDMQRAPRGRPSLTFADANRPGQQQGTRALPVLVEHDPSPGVRPSDPWTSHAAAVDTPGKAGHRGRLKRDIFVLLQIAGEDGHTDDELATCLPDEHPGSVSKRRGDLVRDGHVVNSGRTRTTRWGSEAIVWALAEHVDPVPVLVPEPVRVGAVEAGVAQ